MKGLSVWWGLGVTECSGEGKLHVHVCVCGEGGLSVNVCSGESGLGVFSVR